MGLMRLNTRRLRSDLVETFKIINSKYSIHSVIFFEFDDVIVNRKGHSKKFFKRSSRLNVRTFGNISSLLCTWPSSDFRAKFYGDRPRRTPQSVALNAREVAK